jgi:DNA invertase Pin-like site-specific DNA recombinase
VRQHRQRAGPAGRERAAWATPPPKPGSPAVMARWRVTASSAVPSEPASRWTVPMALGAYRTAARPAACKAAAIDGVMVVPSPVPLTMVMSRSTGQSRKMANVGERARLWQRVSSGDQDEGSQLPDLVRWCDTHDYEYNLDDRYVIHGKSAYKKRQGAALDKAISDMANGQYSVLVVWAFDRIQRGTTLEAFMLAERARAAGGRIEYVLDTYLNETNEMSDVMLALTATAARRESKRKSERVKIKQDGLRAAGSVIGKAPWGYEIICTACNTPPVKPDCKPHTKIFRPTTEGRKYIPAMFQIAIDGNSLRTIAVWLIAEGAGSKIWNGEYIGNYLLKNPAYYGAPRNAGELEIEPLVSYSVWQQASAAVASRVKLGRSAQEKALLAPVCGKPDCDATGEHPSPMYRNLSRGMPETYRCFGRGPQRKGCGNAVDMAQADEWVTGAMRDDGNPHATRMFIPGDSRSDEIGKLRERGADAMKKGDYAAATDCMRQAEELEALPRVAPHWEEFYICHTCGQIKDIAACLIQGHRFNTNAQHFAGLTPAEQREELAQHWVISLVKDGVGVVPRA